MQSLQAERESKGRGAHPRENAVRLLLAAALQQRVGRVRQRQRAQEQQQRRRGRAREAQPPAPSQSSLLSGDPVGTQLWHRHAKRLDKSTQNEN
jgi:hypothetical protein